jgi:hypothetical protein
MRGIGIVCIPTLQETMDAPRITTAVPKARWRFGSFEVVALGEIDSPEPVAYRFILAFVRSGEAKPCFYVTSEKDPAARAGAGSHCLRVIAASGSQEIENSDRFAELESFAATGMRLAAEHLAIVGEPERMP